MLLKLYVLTLIAQKIRVIYGCFTYQTTALLSEMSIFWVRHANKIGLASYGSKHASRCLSDRPFVHTYTQLENYISYMDVQHIERLLYYWRHSLCGLELHERFDWRAAGGERGGQTHVSWSLIQHFVCILQARTYIAVWCSATHDNKTHVPYDVCCNYA